VLTSLLQLISGCCVAAFLRDEQPGEAVNHILRDEQSHVDAFSAVDFNEVVTELTNRGFCAYMFCSPLLAFAWLRSHGTNNLRH
jgi:hypothetical protein